MLFDTLKIAESLQPAFTEDQAKALARTLQDTAGGEVATNGDLKVAISDLRSDLTQQISFLRADTIKWIVTAIVCNFLGMAGLLIMLIKVFGPGPSTRS